MSRTSLHSKARIGAVVVLGREVIAVGVNSATKSHPLQAKYNMTYRNLYGQCKHHLHAEFDAILRAINTSKATLSDAKLYVYREHLDGRIGMCRPCKACMAYIKDMGITEIFYTTDAGLCSENLIDFSLN